MCMVWWSNWRSRSSCRGVTRSSMDGAHRLVPFRRSGRVLRPPGQCIPELSALCSSLLAREGSSLVTGRSNLFASVNCWLPRDAKRFAYCPAGTSVSMTNWQGASTWLLINMDCLGKRLLESAGHGRRFFFSREWWLLVRSNCGVAIVGFQCYIYGTRMHTRHIRV